MNISRTTWGIIKGIVIGGGIRIAIVAGFIMTPQSTLYGNFIYMIHYYYWFNFVMGIVAVVGLAIFSARASLATTEDPIIKSVKYLYVVSKSWASRVYDWVIQWPTLVFVGFVMGDWSLLTAMAFSSGIASLLSLIGADIWTKLPESVKNPVAAAEVEHEAKEASLSPVGHFLADAKERQEKVDNAVNKMAEKIFGGGEE